MTFAISSQDVLAAAEHLQGVAHQTPVFTSRTVDAITGHQVFFKAENLQRAGAFKFRGAYNALSQLPPDDKARGVVAYSSGNHAQGVAYAAKLLDIKATIVMPTDAPATKRAATEDYGAHVHPYDRATQDRVAVAHAVATETGAVIIPPYDHPNIMAGQGTAALELLQDVPDLDVLVVPVGGGGLLSGCATIAHKLRPELVIFGVETKTSNDWHLSFQANQRISIPQPDTIADGMRTLQPGELTYPIIRALVADILLVSDEQVIEAMRLLLTRMKLLAEPTGAVAPAAVLQNLITPPGRRVGVIISGGNVDPSLLACLLADPVAD